MTHRYRIYLSALLCACLALCAIAPSLANEAVSTDEPALTVTRDYMGFVYQNLILRQKKVSYYNDVYAYNHKEYLLQPFDAAVPERFFVMDGQGRYALDPIVLDVTDAMRIALYGKDTGKVALFYGQYTEKIRSANKKWGYSGIHEGLDFLAQEDQPIHAILGGEVLRAGYGKDATIAIYNEEYNTTVLYLHSSKVAVSRGDRIEAGTLIAHEGSKGAGGFYTHVEVRFGKRTSPSPYRNATLESDLPYDFFIKALNITPSGREPITAQSVYEAEAARRAAEAEAEAARRAAEEEAYRLAHPTPAPTPKITYKEEIDSEVPSDFGFAGPTPTPIPIP